MDKGQPQEQIQQWLKKLSQESWQLELLVSAFTIFLLIQASTLFDQFFRGITYEYNIDGSIAIIYFFLVLISYSIKSLVLFLIIHLLLRGFWIGSIGLRSVQATIDFKRLNYSPFFEEKLKKKVINLDNLVMMLDELCSVIFSFSFLVISMLLSFGMFQFFLWGIVILFSSLIGITSGVLNTILTVILSVASLTIVLAGLIYFIDYFTLGFFKKIKWFSKIYYPFYRLFGFITISVISRSIYYYLISKFSKKRIRVVYLIMAVLILTNWLINFDQYQYYSENDSSTLFDPNDYDDLRPADDYINRAGISSNISDGEYVQLFIRYDPQYNTSIAKVCPDFVPSKNDGLNFAMEFARSGANLVLKDKSQNDSPDEMLECLSQYFGVFVNERPYSDLKFYFMEHPSKGQKGIMTMIPTANFDNGENIIEVRHSVLDPADSSLSIQEYDRIPVWHSR